MGLRGEDAEAAVVSHLQRANADCILARRLGQRPDWEHQGDRDDAGKTERDKHSGKPGHATGAVSFHDAVLEDDTAETDEEQHADDDARSVLPAIIQVSDDPDSHGRDGRADQHPPPCRRLAHPPCEHENDERENEQDVCECHAASPALIYSSR